MVESDNLGSVPVRHCLSTHGKVGGDTLGGLVRSTTSREPPGGRCYSEIPSSLSCTVLPYIVIYSDWNTYLIQNVSIVFTCLWPIPFYCADILAKQYFISRKVDLQGHCKLRGSYSDPFFLSDRIRVTQKYWIRIRNSALLHPPCALFLYIGHCNGSNNTGIGT